MAGWDEGHREIDQQLSGLRANEVSGPGERLGDRPIDLAVFAEYRVCVRSGSPTYLSGCQPMVGEKTVVCVWVDGLRSAGSIGAAFGLGVWTGDHRVSGSGRSRLDA